MHIHIANSPAVAEGCSGLTTLDVGGFRNVTDASGALADRYMDGSTDPISTPLR